MDRGYRTLCANSISMNDGLEAIIELVAVLIFLGMMLFPFLLFFIYVFYQNSKRKGIRERTQNAYTHMIGNNRTLPVRYASEPRFRLWWKIFPWEGTGLLVAANGVVTFVGEKNNGTPLNLQFGSNTSSLLWLGKCPFPNGAVSWFAFYSRGEKHYFTSETGAFVFGSQNSTRAAFDEAQASFRFAQGS
jgi:hypothetical protein